jgi:prepilin-type N-terminal cleavage/methylation domain-containing protein/prepilin-type processing-associated H-X9-DG protein
MQRPPRLGFLDQCRRTSRPAFTLIELIVVIGIIALLIALVLPLLSKVRRQAQQVSCLSNLRQMGTALIVYGHQNRGSFPAPGNRIREQVEDWVYWQPGRDETEGRIFRYLGGDLRVLKCPSDATGRASQPTYPFSYSVNNRFTGDSSYGQFGSIWSTPPCRLTEVVESSRKVMAIEEDLSGINDGMWCAGGMDSSLFWTSLVSVLHDKGKEYGFGAGQNPDYNSAHGGRGNVVFADGHGEFIERVKLLAAGNYDPRNRNGPW